MSRAVSDPEATCSPAPRLSSGSWSRRHRLGQGCPGGPGQVRAQGVLQEHPGAETLDQAWQPLGLPRLEPVLGESVPALSRPWPLTLGRCEAAQKAKPS